MSATELITTCFHCGDSCKNESLQIRDKYFCCNGCLNVYQLLNDSNMDEYYCLNESPGHKIETISKEKFTFLDEKSVIESLLLFRNSEQAHVSFYLPQMHCSSCLWLLENLTEINENIIFSQVNFNKKTLKVVFKIDRLSLRQLAELLAHIGYEPIIDLHEKKEEAEKFNSRQAFLKLGVTGFCFANIMMIAFPDYLGLDPAANPKLNTAFNIANVLLSIPVVFYGAQEFFVNAVYSFRQRYLNIDAPIALAIAVTWLRSLYEVFTNTGAGFFDSMSGIVFFMLLGRIIQNRSRTTLKFNRDYKSYFPIAVTKMEGNKAALVKLEEIKVHDVLKIYHQEVIPTDCLLSKGNAKIDYSFVTGEDKTDEVDKSGVIYAGGRNMGETIEVVVIKPFSQNSFTQLWNNEIFNKTENDKESRVTTISKYFSIVVLLLSLGAFLGWQFRGNSDLAWKSATAVLIIACPCALLLTASFTNGYILERFAKIGVYLKNSRVIESMARANYIAFDKTGTLTEPNAADLIEEYLFLNDEELSIVRYIVSQSLHPLSRAINEHYEKIPLRKYDTDVKEIPGKGLEATVFGKNFRIGSGVFTKSPTHTEQDQTSVYVAVAGEVKAKFTFEVSLIPGTREIVKELSKDYELSLISGDNTASKNQLAKIFGDENRLHYHMKPSDKMNFVKERQAEKNKIIMIGDGLNDAGALKQSDVGISVVKSAFAFSPSCDVIMDVKKLKYLPTFLKWAKNNERLINFGFGYSLIFNIIGLAFALTGNLSPLVAAIIMPCSSLGIILIAWLGVKWSTRQIFVDN